MKSQKEEAGYLGRGLHSKNWWSDSTDNSDKRELKDGHLSNLLKIVKEDNDLVLEIRNDYVNIYYKGGNIAKVGPRDSIQFDENYYKGVPDYESDDKKNERKRKKKELLKELKTYRDYNSIVKDMKDLMEKYWEWLREKKGKTLKEKEVQHALCINNTESSEYTIIDVEFQISTNKENKYCYQKPKKPDGRYVAEEKKSPRFDIIAVRNKDHRLCVIELKSGVDALYGKSGVGDHADSFEGSIGRNPIPFLNEIKRVIEDKKNLKLLSDNFSISDSVPEFIYAYSYKENDKDINGNLILEKQQKEFFFKERKTQKCDHYKVMFLKKECYILTDSCLL